MSYQFNRVPRYDAGSIVLHQDLRSDKKRPYLIVSNNSGALEGDSDYIVLPITKSEGKRKKKHFIELDHRSCGLSVPSYIKGNKPDVITQDGIIKQFGSTDSALLELSRKVLWDCIKDESVNDYQRSFKHWIEAYNVAFKKNYTILNVTEGMKDAFHVSMGRFINKNKSIIRIVFKPEYLAELKARIE